MVTVVHIDLGKGLVGIQKFMKRLEKQMPPMTKQVMKKWGPMLEKDMKASAKAAKIKKFSGTLFNEGIQWRQRPNGKVGRLFMRRYGLALDRRADHWVSLKSSRTNLIAWALRANKESIREAGRRALIKTKGKRAPSIRVKRHKFIDRGFATARSKLTRIIKTELKKAVLQAR